MRARALRSFPSGKTGRRWFTLKSSGATAVSGEAGIERVECPREPSVISSSVR
jgi:hypothetical protein